MWEIVGYGLLVISPLSFVNRLLSFNPLLWIYGAVACVFGLLSGLVVLAVSHSPMPNDQEIRWYIDGVAALGGLMILSRFCSFMLRCFAPGDKNKV
jgi:hypothetical protein